MNNLKEQLAAAESHAAECGVDFDTYARKLLQARRDVDALKAQIAAQSKQKPVHPYWFQPEVGELYWDVIPSFGEGGYDVRDFQNHSGDVGIQRTKLGAERKCAQLNAERIAAEKRGRCRVVENG